MLRAHNVVKKRDRIDSNKTNTYLQVINKGREIEILNDRSIDPCQSIAIGINNQS